MGKSPYFRNVLLVLAAGVLLFLINKFLLLVAGIVLLVYLNHQGVKKKRHDDLPLFYQRGGGN